MMCGDRSSAIAADEGETRKHCENRLNKSRQPALRHVQWVMGWQVRMPTSSRRLARRHSGAGRPDEIEAAAFDKRRFGEDDTEHKQK
jgi:hypothetical protein